MRNLIAAIVPFVAGILSIFCAAGLTGLGEVMRYPLTWALCLIAFTVSIRLTTK